VTELQALDRVAVIDPARILPGSSGPRTSGGHYSVFARLARRWQGYRPSKLMLLAACVASFGLSIVVGFASGGWVTGARARMLVALAADDARADLAATVCVSRFLAAPDAAARLAALRSDAPWDRGMRLESAGWTALYNLQDLTGSREPVSGEADLCAHRLMALTEAPLRPVENDAAAVPASDFGQPALHAAAAPRPRRPPAA
jgi:hypothetical protein